MKKNPRKLESQEVLFSTDSESSQRMLVLLDSNIITMRFCFYTSSHYYNHKEFNFGAHYQNGQEIEHTNIFSRQ